VSDMRRESRGLSVNERSAMNEKGRKYGGGVRTQK